MTTTAIPKHSADMPITAVPEARLSSTNLDLEDKGEISALEHKAIEHEDMNSPEAILDRYPLLRVMTEGERDTLNRRVRRRM